MSLIFPLCSDAIFNLLLYYRCMHGAMLAAMLSDISGFEMDIFLKILNNY